MARNDDKKWWCVKGSILNVEIKITSSGGRVGVSMTSATQPGSQAGHLVKITKCLDDPNKTDRCIVNNKPLKQGQASVNIKGSITVDGLLELELNIEECTESVDKEGKYSNQHPILQGLSYMGTDMVGFLQDTISSICDNPDSDVVVSLSFYVV